MKIIMMMIEEEEEEEELERIKRKNSIGIHTFFGKQTVVSVTVTLVSRLVEPSVTRKLVTNVKYVPTGDVCSDSSVKRLQQTRTCH